MNFSDDLADLDRAIEAHLCDDGVLTSWNGPSVAVRVMIDFPAEIDRLQVMSFPRTRPVVSLAHDAAPELREGDLLAVVGQSWRIASAPTRSGDGRWWQAEIEPAE